MKLSLLFLIATGAWAASATPPYLPAEYQRSLPAGAIAQTVEAAPGGGLFVGGTVPPSRPFLARFDPGSTTPAWVVEIPSRGSGIDAIATDPAGNIYAAGTAYDDDFPTTSGAFQSTRNASVPVFVMKLDPGGHVVYTTFIGAYPGTSSSFPRIALNAAGEAFITADALYGDIPAVPGIVVDNPNRRFYTVRLTADGTRAIYVVPGFGGSAIAVDRDNNAYVVSSEQFYRSTTPGVIQPTVPFRSCGGTGFIGIPCFHQYVAKLNATGTQIAFATFLSSQSGERPEDIALDAAGNVWVTGFTLDIDYPVTASAFQPANRALQKRTGYLSQITNDGTNLLYSTYLGGSFADTGRAISFDAEGRVQLALTLESSDFPKLPALPQRCLPDFNHPVPALATLATTLDALASLDLGRALAWLPALPDDAIGCIADSADFTSGGPLSPGQLLSIFGTGIGPDEPASFDPRETALPRSLGGATVQVSGIPAPLLYADSGLINFIAPHEIADMAFATVRVIAPSGASAERLLPVRPVTPSLFVGDAYGYAKCRGESIGRQGALILNADGSRNSCEHPAPRDSVVTLFLNGLGPAPGTSTGEIATRAVPLTYPVEQPNGAAPVSSAVAMSGAPVGVWRIDLDLAPTTRGFVDMQLFIDPQGGSSHTIMTIPLWVAD